MANAYTCIQINRIENIIHMKKHGVEKNHTHVKQYLCLFSFISFCCIIILLYFLCILIFFFLFEVVVRIDLFVYIFCYVLNTRKLCLFDV